MNWCMAAFVFQIGSALAAASAAYLWFKASRMKLPPVTGLSHVIAGVAITPDLGRVVQALENQNKWNARAALVAAGAALLQAFALGLPSCASTLILG